MVKITVTSCCVALCLALTSVSAVQRLNSIDDLRRLNFSQSVPKHSLLLLHWFANEVDIDNNNVIWLIFDPNVTPNGGDYGSHHYGNFEGMLDQLPWGYRYYTIGNLYQETSMPLPHYVLHPQSSEYEGGNSDRIIIVAEQNAGGRVRRRIDRVYITQHINGTGRYDPDHTYQITTNLLRQIREFSVGQNQQTLSYLGNRFGSNADVSYIRSTWGHLACLGLFLFIINERRHPQNRYSYIQQSASLQSRQTHGGAENVWTYGSFRNTEPPTYYRSEGWNSEQWLLCCLLSFLLICVVVFAIGASLRH